MPALQVKDFPADLYEELRACPTAEDRSISQQTVRIVREYLRAYRQIGGRTDWAVVPVDREETRHGDRRRTAEEERLDRIEHRKRVIERIDARPYIEIPDDFPSAAEIVRQMREERDDQIVPELAGIR